MQLNDIAKRVADKDLIGVLSHQPLNLPVPDPTLVQLTPGFLNVLNCQRDMGYGRIFDVAPRYGRSTFRAH